MPFKIRFRGLICHVKRQDGSGRRAVIVRHRGHNPVLIIPNEFVPAGIKLTEVPSQAEGTTTYSLDGKHLEFPGLTGDTTGFDNVAITPLGAISDASRAEGDSGRPATTHVTSSVTYGGGSVRVGLFCENQARFPNGVPPFNEDHCVADTIVFSIDVTTPVEVVADSGNFTLDPNATIVIQNFEKEDDKTGNDFGSYRNVTDATTVDYPVVNEKLPCSFKPGLKVPLRVECSGTQHPYNGFGTEPVSAT